MKVYSNCKFKTLQYINFNENEIGILEKDDLLILKIDEQNKNLFDQIKLLNCYKLILDKTENAEFLKYNLTKENIIVTKYENNENKISKIIDDLSVSQQNKINVCISSHKLYNFPTYFTYKPIIVGVGLKNEFLKQNFITDEGDLSISNKNESYCELTALYKAYKEIDSDYFGLVHYRRLFLDNNLSSKKIDNVITSKTILKILSKYDFILPKKRHYYIESNYSHYIHAHVKEPLDKTIEIIQKEYPEYYPYLKKHLKRTTGHYFNMFITSRKYGIEYLDFLFEILFKLEKQIDISNYSAVEKRVYGYISELLLDVYIDKNQLKVKNQKYLFFDKQNWFKKIFNFVKRKLKHNN